MMTRRVLLVGGLCIVSVPVVAQDARQDLREFRNEQTLLHDRLDTLDRDHTTRLQRLESLHDTENMSQRVALLENDLWEIKWLARAVAATVFGQILIAASSLFARGRHG